MRWINILALMGLEAVLLCAGVSVASRNSSGTMSAINGPYTSGSVISSSVINARLADIETELTDSASRSGKGGFSAPVRGADGTVSAPTFSFTSETGTGLYRIGSSDLGVSISGTKKLELTGSAFTVTPDATLSGAASITGNTTVGGLAKFADGSAVAPSVTWTNDTNSGMYRIAGTGFGVTVSGSQKGAWGTAGLIIGSSGTAISGSFRGTASWTPGLIAAQTCAFTNITVTGAVADTECAVGSASGLGSWSLSCHATANTCTIYLCNITAAGATPTAGTYSCRVFNP